MKETINIYSLYNRIPEQSISIAPGVATAVLGGYGMYRVLSYPLIFVQRGKEFSVPLIEKIFAPLRLLVGKFFFDRDLYVVCRSSKDPQDVLCKFADDILTMVLAGAVFYGIIKSASFISHTVNSFVYRSRWTAQLLHHVQWHIIDLAILLSIRTELLALEHFLEHQQGAPVVLASNIRYSFDRLIEKHLPFIRSCYDRFMMTVKQDFDVVIAIDDATILLHELTTKIQEDLDMLTVPDGALSRVDMVACMQQKRDCLLAITRFYEGCDAIKKESGHAIWKNARKVNEAAQLLSKQMERMLNKNERSLKSTQSSYERGLWFSWA